MKTKQDFEYMKHLFDCLPEIARQEGLSMKPQHRKFLDGNTMILTRQLTHLMANFKQVERGNLMGLQVFPVNSEGGGGLESLNFGIEDFAGEAKFINTRPSDIPMASSNTTERPNPVGTLGIGYQWDELEVRRALRANVSLSERKARAANRGMDQKLDKVVWFGDEDQGSGITGLFSTSTIADIPTNTAVSSLIAMSATALYDELLTKLINTIPAATDGVHSCRTILTTIALRSHIMSKRFTGGSGDTVGDALIAKTDVERIIAVPNRLNSVSTLADKDLLVGYDPTSEVIEVMTPGGKMNLPMRQVDMVFKVPQIWDTAGTFVWQPLGIQFLKDFVGT